jgi:hypothetical protein
VITVFPSTQRRNINRLWNASSVFLTLCVFCVLTDLFQPSKHVLACMVTLRDGTFNGAVRVSRNLVWEMTSILVLSCMIPPFLALNVRHSSTIPSLRTCVFLMLFSYLMGVSLSQDLSRVGPQTNFDNGTVKYLKQFRVEI